MGVSIGSGVDVRAGAGGEVKAAAEVSADEIDLEARLAGALGVGAGGNVHVNIDPKEFVDDVSSLFGF
jgi:hypothetical protein